jgi:hypothetical protein
MKNTRFIMDKIQSYCAINILIESGFVKGSPIPLPKDPSVIRSAELISHLFHQLLMDPSEDFEVVHIEKTQDTEFNQKPLYTVTMNPNRAVFESEEDAFDCAKDLADRITGYDSNHPLPMQADDDALAEDDATLPYRLVFNGVIVQLNLDIEPEFSRSSNSTPKNINQILIAIFEKLDTSLLTDSFEVPAGGFKQTLAEGMNRVYQIKLGEKNSDGLGPELTQLMKNSPLCIRM